MTPVGSRMDCHLVLLEILYLDYYAIINLKFSEYKLGIFELFFSH